MRAVIQRVKQAEVAVDDQVIGKIGYGFLVYLGVGQEDTDTDLNYIVDKVSHLRVFEDENGKMNLSIEDIKGEFLIVSQFTLYGDCRKGRRPSFSTSAPLEMGRSYYERFCDEIRKMGFKVETGEFQAHMQVRSENDGPVTMLLDSQKTF